MMRNEALLALALCAVLLAGCTGQPASPPSGNPPQPAPNNTTPPVANLTPYQSLTRTLLSATDWSADYSLSSRTLTSAKGFTQYAQGGKNFRSDVIKDNGRESRMFVLNGSAYGCSNNGSGWICSEALPKNTFDVTPTAPIYRLSAELLSKPSEYSVTRDGKIILAGTTADCYLVSGSTTATRCCVSPEGVPLYMNHTEKLQNLQVELSATRFSTSVPEGVFKLPSSD